MYNDNGKKTWDYNGNDWQRVINEGKKQGFEAGYDWDTPYDPPHFQDTKGKTMTELKGGMIKR